MAIHTIKSVGIAKAIAGALFATGLMMVIVTGAEIFTGNHLTVVSCLAGRTKWTRMLRSWVFLYIGNLIGSIVVALFIILSGQFNFSDGLLGAYTIKVASYKVSLSFTNAFFLGVLCNWLVCVAIWMAAAAKDIAGKILCIFFPIWLFITSGFEHSIANMYYIPAGILAKSNGAWVDAAIAIGISPEKLDALNWYTLFVNNLIPVTLGNIIGGALFVATIYWLSFLYKDKKSRNVEKDIKK